MARELSRSENVNKLHRCVKSASENLTIRSGINALEDVESDLEGALKAVRALIDADRNARNARYNHLENDPLDHDYSMND